MDTDSKGKNIPYRAYTNKGKMSMRPPKTFSFVYLNLPKGGIYPSKNKKKPPFGNEFS
jgi:hypothetical protein